MTWLDYGVIAVVIFSMAWGAWRGLVNEVFSLAGWIMAFLAGNLFAAPLSEMLPALMRPELRVVVAYVVIFVAVLVIAALIAALITKFVTVSVLHSLNRWLGALFGRTEEEAFFVICDRTTMTQDDILNGRLICEIGIAPARPAEFVIFRVFQSTAEAGM